VTDPRPFDVALRDLISAVTGDNRATTADLRRSGERPTPAMMQLLAGAGFTFQSDAYRDAALVVSLAATFHRGDTRWQPGSGTFGYALGRVPAQSSGKHVIHPAAERIVLRTVNATRGRLDRMLRSGITLLRANDKQPPNWNDLFTDIRRWDTPSVRDRWVDGLYRPPKTAPKTTTSNSNSN
jgi:hypothetical protein